ncbi:MAG: pseudouridine-5'-phosphate glycosidase [Chloroflexi bacterium]|nr:pseudouridine-5'-phosphate glycosidase [Chloroflexota bacterium]
MQVHPDIRRALDAGRAVVALESTLICHGRPYPGNREVALAMEQAIVAEGAGPATIALLSGEPCIGLDASQIEYLARQGHHIRKCSRRDLPIVMARGLDGATTVSATMILAHQAGIQVFATGGIGGVHRGHPFDVSADLEELARTPIVVVCSGAKALLDLQATRERLETSGVPVLGYQTDQFPAFYSRESGLLADLRVEGPEEVAAIARARDHLGLSGAVLVGVPVPAQDELPRAEAEAAIGEAVRQADEQGIQGYALTPFLLQRVSELTEGRSPRANYSLLVNNARVAAGIARALATQKISEV